MRELTEGERAILETMLRQLPAGDAELRRQLMTAQAYPIDDEGSVGFEVTAPPAADVTERVPVTAIFDDIDKVPIYILLHIVKGRLSELEIYKADGSRIITQPIAAKLYF
jgi:hypothetical protein